MSKNANSRVASRLRWQFFTAWTLLLLAVTGVVFSAMWAKMGSLILESQVEKLRPAARELSEVCADYLMSASDRQLDIKFAKIMKEFPELSYVLFVDRHGEVHSRGSHQSIDSLRQRLAGTNPQHKDANFIEVRGKTYVDIGEMTPTLPPLPVHVGFAKALTDAKKHSLLWNRGAIALVSLAVVLVGGFLLSVWLSRPLVDLSTRAERLSLGDMNVRLDLKCGGEIARVYHSLQRLRESVLYALRRLNDTDRRIKPQTEDKPPEKDEPARERGRIRIVGRPPRGGSQ